jgi:glycosyltransferase involved in cell wall biosynthesis
VLSTRTGLWRWVDRAGAAGRHLRMVAQLRRAATGYDVVYVHAYKDLALVSAALACGGHARVVWHCHGLGDGPPPAGLRWLANGCAAVLAVSASTRARLLEIGVAAERVHVVYNAIDRERILRLASAGSVHPLPDRRDRIVILAPVANVRPDKGLHLVVDALAQLPSRCVLWITGDRQDRAAANYVAALEGRAKRYRLGDRLQFIGFRDDVYGVMRESDIVCMASTCREGFGLVAAEGMALGKAVVVSDRGALPEVVAFGQGGLVFDPDRPDELAEGLRSLCRDDTYRAAVARRGRERAEATFSYAHWSDQVAAHLGSAARSESPTPAMRVESPC